METFASTHTEQEATDEHTRLVDAGYSDYEARAMVYEEEEEPFMGKLTGLNLLDLALWDAGQPGAASID